MPSNYQIKPGVNPIDETSWYLLGYQHGEGGNPLIPLNQIVHEAHGKEYLMGYQDGKGDNG
jgi:hypothetical protein